MNNDYFDLAYGPQPEVTEEFLGEDAAPEACTGGVGPPPSPSATPPTPLVTASFALEKTLLGLGGKLAMVYDDAEFILSRGRMITPKKVKFKKGQPRESHLNTSLAYLALYPAYQIVTGYALSASGLWARHSWLQAHGGVILETTGKWKRYFGAPLDEKDTAKFVWGEIIPMLPGMEAWQREEAAEVPTVGAAPEACVGEAARGEGADAEAPATERARELLQESLDSLGAGEASQEKAEVAAGT
jgi:hypothetical protein